LLIQNPALLPNRRSSPTKRNSTPLFTGKLSLSGEPLLSQPELRKLCRELKKQHPRKPTGSLIAYPIITRTPWEAAYEKRDLLFATSPPRKQTTPPLPILKAFTNIKRAINTRPA
jgi:hypothetical protein